MYSPEGPLSGNTTVILYRGGFRGVKRGPRTISLYAQHQALQQICPRQEYLSIPTGFSLR